MHRWGGLAGALLLVACSGQHRPADSRTPRITVGSSSGLGAALLSTADLQAVPGLPAGIQSVALSSLDVFQDPDPRGPCGAKIAPLDLAGGAGTGIRSSSAQGAELVLRLGDAAAKSRLDAIVADARPGCRAYQTVTNRGGTQTVVPEAVVRFPSLDDGAVVIRSRVVNAGQSVEATQLVVRRGGLLAVTTLFSAGPLSDATTRSIAARVAARLRSAG